MLSRCEGFLHKVQEKKDDGLIQHKKGNGRCI